MMMMMIGVLGRVDCNGHFAPRGDQSSFQVVNPTQLAAAIHIILQRAAAFDVCIIPETGELGRSKAPSLSLQRYDSRGHPKFEIIH